jgi:hypothetical protein
MKVRVEGSHQNTFTAGSSRLNGGPTILSTNRAIRELTMKYAGLTIFIVFFGISLLDALWGGNWLRALFWVGIGLTFFALDRVRQGRSSRI